MLTSDGIAHESLNHYSKGSVVSFLHRHVAGLVPTSPGYRTFAVRPRPGGGISRVSQRLDTRYGRIDVEWHLVAGRFVLRVTVPTGTEATVHLPSGERLIAAPGSHTWTCRQAT